MGLSDACIHRWTTKKIGPDVMKRGRLFEGLLWVMAGALALSAVLAGVAPYSVESHSASPGNYYEHTWRGGQAHHTVKRYKHHNFYYQQKCRVVFSSFTGFPVERCDRRTGPLEPPARFGLNTVCEVSGVQGSRAGGWENGGRWWYKAAPSANGVTGCGADGHYNLEAQSVGARYKFSYARHENRVDGASSGVCLLAGGEAVWGRGSSRSAPRSSPVYDGSSSAPSHRRRCGEWVSVVHNHTAPTTRPPTTRPPTTRPPAGWSGGCRWSASVGVRSVLVLPSFDPGGGGLVSYRLVGSLPRGMVETGGRIVGAPLTAGAQTFRWRAQWGGSSRVLDCRIEVLESAAPVTTRPATVSTVAPVAPAPSPPRGWNGECRFTVRQGFSGWNEFAWEAPVYDPGRALVVSMYWVHGGDFPRGLRTTVVRSGNVRYNDRVVGLSGTVSERARPGVYRSWLGARWNPYGLLRPRTTLPVGDRLPCVIEVVSRPLPALRCPSVSLTAGEQARVRFPAYTGGRVVSYHFPQSGVPAGMSVSRSSSSSRSVLVLSGVPERAGEWSGLYQVTRNGEGKSVTCRFSVSPAATTTTVPAACSRAVLSEDMTRLRAEVGWRSGFRRAAGSDVRPAGLPTLAGEGYWFPSADPARPQGVPDIWPVWSDDLSLQDSSGCSWSFGSVVSSARALFVWLPDDLAAIRRVLPAVAARWDAMDSEQRELLEASDRLRLRRAGLKTPPDDVSVVWADREWVGAACSTAGLDRGREDGACAWGLPFPGVWQWRSVVQYHTSRAGEDPPTAVLILDEGITQFFSYADYIRSR